MSKIEDALKKAMKEGVSSSRQIASNKQNLNKNNLIASSSNGTSQLATVSRTKEIVLMDDPELFDTDQLSELGIIHAGMDDRKLANSYRDIRTKLIQKSKGENFIVMATSCYSDDDASSFVSNLAAAFTFDESKTSLLIDCNLHNTQLDNKFNLDNALGLTDYLRGDHINIESIVQKSGVKRLRMIPVGTQNETSTECFTSLKMRNLMSDLLKRYSDRYIFINSAPVKDSADTRILIELCDYVILTVPYGCSSLTGVKDAVEAIGKDKLLGIVLNDIPSLPKINLSGFSANNTKS